MEDDLLGRTNRHFPPVWFDLHCPNNPLEIEDLVTQCLSFPTVYDISSNPVLFGNSFRGQDDLVIKYASSFSIERATSENHAFDLVQAELIQILSCIGRMNLDFFMLSVRNPLEKFQINGALSALGHAVEEGLISHVGLNVKGSATTSLALWQFHDAFDIVEIDLRYKNEMSFQALQTLSVERRVGMVVRFPESQDEQKPFIYSFDLNGYGAVEINVSSAELVEKAIQFALHFHPKSDDSNGAKFLVPHA